MPLRTRLLLGMATIALVLAVAAAVITQLTRDHLTSQVDEELRAVGVRITQVGQLDTTTVTPANRLSDLFVGRLTEDGRLVTVAAPERRPGTPRPRLDPGDVEALRAGRIITTGGTDGAADFRLIGRTLGEGTPTLVFGLSLADVDAAVGRLMAVQVTALASILAVLGLVTWWVLRLGVRPVRRMTRAATAIAAGDLSLRVPDEEPGTEAGDLSGALNTMLGQIEAAFDERTAAEARLRQFIADASHELRTPVTTIRGYAELYRTGALAEPEQLAEAMARTEAEAVRMGTLVDDLLHLARLDQGRPLADEPVDLSRLVEEAVADARAVAPGQPIEADVAAGVVVRGDDGRLRQVVGNLLANARVHAPGAAVRVTLRAEDDRAVLEVRDEGPGMAPEDARRAFERFYRADGSRSRHAGGSGLGLAIVEATARAHRGTARIDSALGAGTAVVVEVPRTADG